MKTYKITFSIYSNDEELDNDFASDLKFLMGMHGCDMYDLVILDVSGFQAKVVSSNDQNEPPKRGPKRRKKKRKLS